MLTYNLTKSYNKCPLLNNNNNNTNNNNINNNINNMQDRPSKVYDTMFKSSDIWMGYADFDTKNYQNKLI
jgi:hypothetical protein